METTSHSPQGRRVHNEDRGFITKTVFEEGCVSVRWHIERRKRLAKGECSFLSERRQAAELARTSISHTPYMCGNGNENTSRVYGRFAR